MALACPSGFTRRETLRKATLSARVASGPAGCDARLEVESLGMAAMAEGCMAVESTATGMETVVSTAITAVAGVVTTSPGSVSPAAAPGIQKAQTTAIA